MHQFLFYNDFIIHLPMRNMLIVEKYTAITSEDIIHKFYYHVLIPVQSGPKNIYTLYSSISLE